MWVNYANKRTFWVDWMHLLFPRVAQWSMKMDLIKKTTKKNPAKIQLKKYIKVKLKSIKNYQIKKENSLGENIKHQRN